MIEVEADFEIWWLKQDNSIYDRKYPGKEYALKCFKAGAQSNIPYMLASLEQNIESFNRAYLVDIFKQFMKYEKFNKNLLDFGPFLKEHGLSDAQIESIGAIG